MPPKINIFSSEKIPYVDNGYYFKYDKIGNHPYHHAGMIYVQEPGAMAPAECLDTNPDWRILDLCAAPGGKSSQLKNKLWGDGVLVSNEIIPSRCKILTGNIERLGLKNTVTTCMDTGRLAKVFPKVFDLIMVDAPCSGEGMFRKEEIAIDEWSQSNVDMCAKRQAEILENAVKVLKSGGYIIYATCTFSLEENEMTIDKPKPVEEGDRILISDGNLTGNQETGASWYFLQQNRIPGMIVLAGVFLLCLLIIGRMKGLTTIVALGFTGAAVFAVYIPAILSGRDVYTVTIVITVFIIFASLSLLNGLNKKTLCAIVGNLGGIIVSGVLAAFVNSALKITGLVDEGFVYLMADDSGGLLDLRAIVWSCIIIGSLGAIMDVSMSIASAMLSYSR